VTRWHAEQAWLTGGGLARDVLIEASGDRFTSVVPGADCPPDAIALRGLTLPGLANAHSHAFHRALRGVAAGGDFWAWRTVMYSVAERLDPDSYYRLARAVYAEMALAGISCVGEFHYLHDGSNEFGYRLIEAARDAGLRITLLDTCYLTAGPSGEPLSGPQVRFSDGSVDGWARRVSDFGEVPAYARLGGRSRRAAARAPVRAASRERGVAGGLRPHPGPGARRRRGARPPVHDGARHAPDRRGYPAAGRIADHLLFLPDD
jgi:cytosine/adenosine deaminase-related metal-dependent hydrolase